MAEWWQSPAYEARKAAGEVVTPGLVDWGGMGNDIYKFLQAPYEARVAREAASAPEPPSMMDPVELYRQAGYTAQPRFGTMPPKVTSSPKVTLQNPYPGPTPVAKTQDRLAPTPAGLPPGYGSGYKATPRFSTASPLPPGQAMFGINLPTIKGTGTAKGYTATPRFSTARAGSGIIELDLDLGDRGAQGMADSEGKPVRVKSGKVYYPGGKGPTAPRPAGTPPGVPGGQRQGGLLSLFGGNGGGLLAGLFGGGSSSGGGQMTRAPLAGSPMLVDPSTRAGSVLESMGYSSGGSVPAATVRNLESRGYFN